MADPVAQRGKGQQQDRDGELVGMMTQIEIAGGACSWAAIVGSAMLAMALSNTDMEIASHTVAAA